MHNPDGSYTAPNGFFTRLVRNADGSFTERDAAGTATAYAAPNGAGIARLTSVTDRNGNTLSYQYNGQDQLTQVVDSLGRNITYTYRTDGRLQEVRDFAGRAITFTYTLGGDLETVTSPIVTGTPTGNDFPTGTTVRYSYSASFADARLNHNLLSITAPNEVALGGPARVVLTYDTNLASPNVDRVLAQTIGGTNGSGVPSGGTINYAYSSLAAAVPGDFTTATFQNTVTDRNGNVTEYRFNQQGNIIRTREFTTPGLRGNQPAFFETNSTYNADYLPAQLTRPEGNSAASAYDAANPERLSQGNLLSATRLPDVVRGGDQASLRSTYTYEPLYNQVRTVTDPRGNDPTYVPAFGGSNTPERYRTVSTFDYQEGTDYAGLAARLGLTAAEVQASLAAAGVPMGLGDVNGDGLINQISGNVIRIEGPQVHLLPGSNQDAVEGSPLHVQPVVTLFAYNAFGQLVRTTDPEGNVALHEYHPARDPNGDGTIDNPAGDPATGGYLRRTTQDAVAAPGRNSGTNPTPAAVRLSYLYDAVGNLTRFTDGRGVVTVYVVNTHNQVVETRRAVQVNDYGFDPVAEPLWLEAFNYLERTFYDRNGNVVLRQVEDRGNTSNTDGNLPVVGNPDPVGGAAFVDTAFQYDRLDQQIEVVQEVTQGAVVQALRTRFRYDRNGNRVMTIHPEGNAEAAIYDERDLLFRSIAGANTQPVAGLFAATDPATFNRPGDAGTQQPGVFTYNYDRNGNLIESVDAQANGGASSLIAGVGDVSTTAYDGFDRPRTATDPLGNQTVRTYDPASNVVRVVTRGEPVNDVPGSAGNVTLAVTEHIFDELSRNVVSHAVLFRTPGHVPSRVPILTDTPAMDALAAYLPDAPFDNAPVPGVADITVLGRVSSLTDYDRAGRVSFTVGDDLDTARTFCDGMGRVICTVDGALDNGFDPLLGTFNPALLAGNSTETAYDDASNVIETAATDVSSVPGLVAEVFRTTQFYDALGRLQTAVDNLGQTEDYRSDSRGNLVASADARGPVTTRTIQRRGLGSSATVLVNDFGNVTLTYVDGIGRTLETQQLLTDSGSGNGSFIGADLFGVRSAPPPGYLATGGSAAGDGIISTYFAHDDNSGLLARRDDNGNVTAWIFDNRDRAVVQRQGLSVAGTTFSLAGGDDGVFHVGLRGGLATTDTEPNGTDITSAYDRDSQPTTRTEEAGNVLSWTNDALGRPTFLAVSGAAAFFGTTLQSWQYDGLGRPTILSDNNDPAMTDDDATTTRFYDSLSRPVEEQQQLGMLPARVVSWNYDIATGGAVAAPTSLVYPDGRQLDSSYDRLDRLVSRQDNGQASAIGAYQYLGPDRVATLTFQNNTRLTRIGQVGGVNTDVGFDGVQRMVNHRWESFTPGVTALGSGTLRVGFASGTAASPGYDRTGNRLVLQRLHDGGNSETYASQSDGQLRNFARGSLDASGTTVVTPTTSAGALQAQSWELDGLGNWTNLTHTTGGVAATESRTATDYNEVGTRGGTPYGAGAAGPLMSDRNGNMTDDGQRLFVWDGLNRLREVRRKSDTALLAVYSYDADGRRMRKVVSNGGLDGTVPNGTTDFAYDGLRAVEERDGGNAVSRQYVFGAYLDEVWTVDDRRFGQSVAALNDGFGG